MEEEFDMSKRMSLTIIACTLIICGTILAVFVGTSAVYSMGFLAVMIYFFYDEAGSDCSCDDEKKTRTPKTRRRAEEAVEGERK